MNEELLDDWFVYHPPTELSRLTHSLVDQLFAHLELELAELERAVRLNGWNPTDRRLLWEPSPMRDAGRISRPAPDAPGTHNAYELTAAMTRRAAFHVLELCPAHPDRDRAVVALRELRMLFNRGLLCMQRQLAHQPYRGEPETLFKAAQIELVTASMWANSAVAVGNVQLARGSEMR